MTGAVVRGYRCCCVYPESLELYGVHEVDAVQ
jgi:hypothetical protein